jgi:hypothetical protein
MQNPFKRAVLSLWSTAGITQDQENQATTKGAVMQWMMSKRNYYDYGEVKKRNRKKVAKAYKEKQTTGYPAR